MLPDAPPYMKWDEEVARQLTDFNKRLQHLERLEGPGGAWNLIETIELAAPAATIDFLNIPATYQHLKLEGSARTTRATAGIQVALRFNNDSGNNYYSLFGQIVHVAVVATAELLASSRIEAIVVPGALAPANSFGSFELTIPDYVDTNKHKMLHNIGATFENTTTGNIKFKFGSGIWQSTTAINRITLYFTTADNFDTHTLVSLYGIAG